MRSSQSNPTLADIVVERLRAMGIRMFFGIPGGAIAPLYDALSRAARAERIRLVTARHEAGAAFMAYGWWLETGTLAAVVATTGPGAINAIAGAACANVEHAPLLVLTGQVPAPKQGRNALQESSDASRADTVAMYAACAKFSTAVSHPDQLDAKLALAYVRAHEGLPGLSHLSFPTDVLRMPAPEASAPPDYAALVRRDRTLPSREVLERTVADIDRSRRPVILLGELGRPAVPPAFAFAERIDAPVCVALGASGTVSDAHILHTGRFGLGGHEPARQAVREADLIVAVGLTGGEFEAAAWMPQIGRTIVVSESSERLARMPDARCRILGTPALVLESLARECRQKPAKTRSVPWKPDAPKTRTGHGVPPASLVRSLAERLPSAVPVYVDNGNAIAWMARYFHATHAYGPVRFSFNYGAMGWTIGASVGAALATGCPVVCLTGDGAFLMAGQEFSTAVQEKLATVFVVFNDHAYGMVRHGQILGGAEPAAFDLPPTDFAAIGRAMGGHGIRIGTLRAFNRIDWPAILARKGPTVIDVRIDGEQVPPIGERVRGLAET